MDRNERIEKIEEAMLEIAKIKAESIQDKRCRRGGLTRVGEETFKAKNQFLDGCAVCMKRTFCETRQCILKIENPDGAKTQKMHNALQRHGWLDCGRKKSVFDVLAGGESFHERQLRKRMKNEFDSMSLDDWSFLRAVSSDPQNRNTRKEYMDFIVVLVLRLHEEIDMVMGWIVSQSRSLSIREGYLFLDMTLWSMRTAWEMLLRDEEDEADKEEESQMQLL